MLSDKTKEKKHRVCPVALAGSLDFSLRKWFQDPLRILGPYVKEGMTALDLGCGPGFFTLGLARLLGPAGMVTAADLQEGMLDRTRAKIESTGLAARVRFHLCQSDRIGLEAPFDFILAFWMLHEVPDPARFLREIRGLLRPGGRALIAEPKWHVTKRGFLEAVGQMREAGFCVLAEPEIRFSRSVVLGGAAPGQGK